ERDQPPAGLEVPRQQLPDFFGIPGLRERREADQVGEEDRDEPPFRGRSLERRCRCGSGVKGRTALPAELFAASDAGPAGGARLGERRPALRTELLAFLVFSSGAGA